MTYQLRPARRSNAKPLIGLYALSGRGKTYSALLLACGFVGGDMAKVAMIETESGRGEAFADDELVGSGNPHGHEYQIIPLAGDFSPTNYGAAIRAVEASDCQALIIDSASHEWEGAGGVLDMAASNQAAGKKGVLVWQQPKIDHQRQFMLRLMQTPIPLVVVCMRAKYPMEQLKIITPEVKQMNPRAQVGDWVRSGDLEPKQSEDILYEMFVHGWIDEQHNFRGTKYTLPALRQVLIDGEPLSIDSGRRLAAWAAGMQADKNKPLPAGEPQPPFITPDQEIHIGDELAQYKLDKSKLLAAASQKLQVNITSLSRLPADAYDSALAWIEKAKAPKNAKPET